MDALTNSPGTMGAVVIFLSCSGTLLALRVLYAVGVRRPAVASARKPSAGK
jgi:hypothetical protein